MSSIDVLCYLDWFFSLSFGIFRGFYGVCSRCFLDLFPIVWGCPLSSFLDVFDVDLSSLFIVGEPPHRV
jgi:hypothetical protein